MTLVRSLGLIGVLLLAGCDVRFPRPPEEMSTTTQAIINGSSSPQLTPLTTGQNLAIGFFTDGSGRVYCSGTLIGRRIVLTAEHCVDSDRSLSSVRFNVGSPTTVRASSKLEYVSRSGGYYDIALVKLETDLVSEVSGLTPLGIYRGSLGEFAMLEAAGYGIDQNDEHVKRFAVVITTMIWPNFIDADGMNEKVCFGDSGGPLMITDSSATPSIIAVHSTASVDSDENCTGDSSHARVDVVADWIDDEVDWLTAAGDPKDVKSSKAPGIGGDNSGYRQSITCGVQWATPASSGALVLTLFGLLLAAAWRQRSRRLVG